MRFKLQIEESATSLACLKPKKGLNMILKNAKNSDWLKKINEREGGMKEFLQFGSKNQ